MDNKVDFYVHGYQQVHIGGYTFWITTSHVCLVIVMAASIALCNRGKPCYQKGGLPESADRIFKCHRASGGNRG